MNAKKQTSPAPEAIPETIPDTTPEAAKDRYFIVALSKGLQVLRCFNEDRRELSTAEIARLTGMPQPSVWRLCYTLLQEGFLVKSSQNDKLLPYRDFWFYTLNQNQIRTSTANSDSHNLSDSTVGSSCSLTALSSVHRSAPPPAPSTFSAAK